MVRNSFYNMLGLGLPLVAAVITIPMLLDALGTEKFGVLTLIWAVVSYFGLFDLGLGRALTQQLSVSWAKNDSEAADELVFVGLGIMALIGIVAALLMAATAGWITGKLAGIENPDEVVASVYAMALAVPFIVLTTGLRGILEAKHRFGIINLIRLPMGLYTFVAPVVVTLYISNSLEDIAIALTLGRVASFFAHAFYCRGLVSIPASGARYRPGVARRLTTAGGWIAVSNILGPLMSYVDRMIIGMVVSVSAITYYATPYEVVSKLWVIPGALTAAIFPLFSEKSHRHISENSSDFRLSVVLIFGMMFVPTMMLSLFSREILSLWLSSEFAGQSYMVMIVFCVGAILNGLATVPFTYIQGVGQARYTALIHAVQFPVFVVSLYIFSQAYGLMGAAGVWLARIVVDNFLMFLVVSQVIGLRIREVIRFIAAGLSLVAVGLSLLMIMEGLVAKLAALVLLSLAAMALCAVEYRALRSKGL
ncbi:MAG: flippase [Gammaproteobacteria bacterium]|nr:flippase [Gammaproteobacteria bacterium]